MNKYIGLFFLGVLVLLNACKQPSGTETPTQGVKGKLSWVEGNQMPGPGKAIDKQLPVKRTVIICQELTSKDLSGQQPLFDKIPADKVVLEVKSNQEGIFMAELPTGKYSILIKEEEGYFANRMNGQGILNPIVVTENKLTEVEVVINYKAVY